MARKSRKSAAAQPRIQQSTISLLVLLVMGVAALWGCGDDLNLPAPKGEEVDGALGDTGECRDEWRGGIPTLAGHETRLICRQEYVAVYDPQHRIPRVVGEYLATTELGGNVPRANNFMPDPDLPEHESAAPNDYRGSGYDRGHMAPAADFSTDEQAMQESFYLSNIVPQNGPMNRGIWADLESAARDCAKREGGLFILTGPVLGTQPDIIGSGVAVPDALFKVVVSGRSVRAFVIENHEQPDSANFERYEVTADEVQQMTGLHLFPDGSVETAAKGQFCTESFGG